MLLRALGYTDEGFLERFVRHFDFLEAQWDKERELAPTQEEALLEIYKRARPGEPPSSSPPAPTSRTPSSTRSATT